MYPVSSSDLLVERPGSDYGIHTEMFPTGLMRLHEAGKVTNRKGIQRRPIRSPRSPPAHGNSTTGWMAEKDVRFLPVGSGESARDHLDRIENSFRSTARWRLDLLGQIVADRDRRTSILRYRWASGFRIREPRSRREAVR